MATRIRQRRLGRWTLVLGVLVAVSILGTALTRRQADTPTSNPPTELLRYNDAAALTPVNVRRVIDGDTLDVEAQGTVLRVRVFGINATEVGEHCSSEATARLNELADGSVRLRADARLQDEFGRELRYLYTPDGHSIDASLVVEGLAHAWRKDGALRDQLMAYEDQAHAARRGCLWQNG